jgi:hypothetical protein
MIRILSLILMSATVAFTGAASAADQAKPKAGHGLVFLYNDGENWRSWDSDTRLMYVAGYRDGRNHGLYELQVDYEDCDNAAAKIQGLFSGISTEQLVDSATKFYSDPTNRPVTVPDALTFAVEEVIGIPASVLQKHLENIRRLGVSNKQAIDK